MKLPRWLVISMLTTSALSVPAAAGWWWVTWPERTVQAFVEQQSAWERGDAPLPVSDALHESVRESMREYARERWGPNPKPLTAADVIPQRRTLWDILIGRQDYEFPGGVVFAALRAEIVGKGQQIPEFYFQYRRLALSSADKSAQPEAK